MTDFRLSRRQFLRIASITGTLALTGCSDQARRLIPYVVPPEDIVPGEATWYATTCRECPAGCGLLAKNRDGHVIKVEGNPGHPVNTGKVCPRGQASIQGIYNPDRYRQPSMRESNGKLRSISWIDAERMLVERLSKAVRSGQKGRVVFLTGLITGSRKELVGRWVNAVGGNHTMYEPIAYEALRTGNHIVFGQDSIPTYRIDKADFLLSFGANFLEYWVSNVQFARQFARFHEPGQGGQKNVFVYVGPRLSMTAANADYWLKVPVGTESWVARALLALVSKDGSNQPSDQEITPEVLQARTGVSTERLLSISRHLTRAKSPLILAEGTGFQDPRPLETVVAANMLQSVYGPRGTVDWGDPVSIGHVVPVSRMKELADRMAAKEIDVLVIDSANPVFHLPASWGFEAALQRVPFVVSFSSYPDETGSLAHLVMPTNTFLECWGDYSPRSSVQSMLQPVMGRIFSTRQLEDVLLSTGRQIGTGEGFPEKNAYELVKKFWIQQEKKGIGLDPESSWIQNVQRGGAWPTEDQKGVLQDRNARARPKGTAIAFTFSTPQQQSGTDSGKSFDFITYPTIQFFDGRLANRPFLEEMPDPVTMIPWEGWIEVSPRTAKWLNVEQGDVITIRSGDGTIEGPVYIYPGLADNTVAMPFGRGHSPSFGRYVGPDKSGNAINLISPKPDASGGLVWSTVAVSVSKRGGSVALARADGSGYQHGRHLARDVALRDFRNSAGQKPDIVMPLPEGCRKDVDFYPVHHHDEYRWGMAIDLDRCIGCQSCVIACYAENNVGIVGKENFRKGREMSWIHVERYFEQDQPFIRFLPVLCQHCDEAPCESVCPVFAPHHNKEGINNQIYNRCIGTRYCNQNCPWKVRRFNWFTWHHEEPLGWQLNPDVTVRQKGVMEKCSFCIQRIVQAKTLARSEGRAVKDGEIMPACAQTCPADVFTFGNLKDRNSKVSRVIREHRAYQLLGELNTKPAVFYLKRIVQPV